MIWWLTVIVLISSFVGSYLLNTSAMTVIGKKVRQVVPVSLATNLAGWGGFYIVGYVSNWSIPVIAAEIAGDILGDLAVAYRWPPLIYYYLVPKKSDKPKPKKPKEDQDPINL